MIVAWIVGPHASLGALQVLSGLQTLRGGDAWGALTLACGLAQLGIAGSVAAWVCGVGH